jgi:hypothetical protein
MADLKWEGNAKAMFEQLMEMAPKPFRAITERNLTDAMVAKVGDGGTVSEGILIDCVKEVTPKPFVGMALKSIEPLKSS